MSLPGVSHHTFCFCLCLCILVQGPAVHNDNHILSIHGRSSFIPCCQMRGCRISVCFVSKTFRVWKLWQPIISASFKSNLRFNYLLTLVFGSCYFQSGQKWKRARGGKREQKLINLIYFTCTNFGHYAGIQK